MSFSDLSPAQQEFFLNGPALMPPEGILPNFDNPPNSAVMTRTIVIICLCLATIAFLLRAYAKLFKIRKVKVEDLMALIAFGTYVGYISVYFRVKNCAVFIHQWDIRVKDLAPILYAIQVNTNLYPATLLAIKIAILVDWIRIFVPLGTRNSFFWTCCVMLTLNILYYTAGIISLNLACIPYNAIWDVTISGQCINEKAIIISGNIINLISDIIILALPQKVIWGLHISTKKKVGVSIAFAIGIFGCASAVARLVASVAYLRTDDSLYKASEVSLWAVSEMTCAFLVFCVPSFPRAFAGQGFATKITSSMRSLLKTRESASENWSRRNPTVPHSNSTYRKMQEDRGYPLKGVSSTQSILPRTLEPQQHESNRGVLLTKDFTTTEEYVIAGSEPKSLQDQYRWTERQ